MVVDDYLPVTCDNKLLFTSSKEVGEVWPSLMEKAYAKLQGVSKGFYTFTNYFFVQGSYFHLNGGFSTSAMVDFSGGFPEVNKVKMIIHFWGTPCICIFNKQAL